jgi:hypothetical protein
MNRDITETSLNLLPSETRPKPAVMTDVRRLVAMHGRGALGGQHMPEDVHPALPRDSASLAHYFTLCMALNYQRDSFALWRAATRTFEDPETAMVFDPAYAAAADTKVLSQKLLKHRLALQPIKHTHSWQTICRGICDLLDGDVRNLFLRHDNQVGALLAFIQVAHKKRFPYLSGPKICNYWLYVMDSYTSWKLGERHLLSVAPDTHVIQASIRLGLIPSLPENGSQELRMSVATAWRELLAESEFAPIDVHTPLWLWSRGGFIPIES